MRKFREYLKEDESSPVLPWKVTAETKEDQKVLKNFQSLVAGDPLAADYLRRILTSDSLGDPYSLQGVVQDGRVVIRLPGVNINPLPPNSFLKDSDKFAVYVLGKEVYNGALPLFLTVYNEDDIFPAISLNHISDKVNLVDLVYALSTDYKHKTFNSKPTIKILSDTPISLMHTFHLRHILEEVDFGGEENIRYIYRFEPSTGAPPSSLLLKNFTAQKIHMEFLRRSGAVLNPVKIENGTITEELYFTYKDYSREAEKWDERDWIKFWTEQGKQLAVSLDREKLSLRYDIGTYSKTIMREWYDAFLDGADRAMAREITGHTTNDTFADLFDLS